MTTDIHIAPTRLARLATGHWAPLPVVLAGTFMVVLDFFIVNVALPSIGARLHAGAGAIEWVLAGYALTNAVFLITASRLGDRFGRRRAFVAGLGVFTVASGLCGFAPSPGALVAARLLQGAGGALLMPNVLAIINVAYAGAERVRALAAYGLTMGVAAVGGQLIGGALIALDPAGLGWRTCFLINLPIGAAALLAAPRVIVESRDQGAEGVDGAGTILLTGALVAIVLPLVQGRSAGWPPWTWLSLAAAPLLSGAFVAHQRMRARRARPRLVELSLFAGRDLGAGLLTQLVFWCGQASFFMVLALYLQQGRGLTPLQAGLVFTILAAAYLAASFAAPALAMRHGRRVLALGALTLAAGHGLLIAAIAAIGHGGSVLALAPGLLLEGAGMGLAITPLTAIILAAAPPGQEGGVSGLLTTMQQIGAAIGVAVIGVLFFGALHSGIDAAFQLSLAALVAILLAVAALTRLLAPGAAVAGAAGTACEAGETAGLAEIGPPVHASELITASEAAA